MFVVNSCLSVRKLVHWDRKCCLVSRLYGRVYMLDSHHADWMLHGYPENIRACDEFTFYLCSLIVHFITSNWRTIRMTLSYLQTVRINIFQWNFTFHFGFPQCLNMRVNCLIQKFFFSILIWRVVCRIRSKLMAYYKLPNLIWCN